MRAQAIAHHEFWIAPSPLVGLGDVDGDGVPDFLGSLAAGPHAYSGRDLSALWALPAVGGLVQFGDADLVGDLDGDGVEEVAIQLLLQTGASPDGFVHIRSGRTGALLRSCAGPTGIFFVQHLARAGDVDADGFEDVITSWVTGLGASQVWVFSGASGAVLHTMTPAALGGGFGNALAGIGDLDGDGQADIAVGAPGFLTSAGSYGQVTIHSGASGTVLATWDAAPNESWFGHEIAPLGDIDGDGTPDVAISAPGLPGTPQQTPQGIVRACSGASGSTIWTAGTQLASHKFGIRLLRWNDVDGDGVRDLLAGSSYYAPPDPIAVRVLSGRTGVDLVPDFSLLLGAIQLARLGDLNADGCDDVGLMGVAHTPPTFLAVLPGWPDVAGTTCGNPSQSMPCQATLSWDPSCASLSVGNGLGVRVASVRSRTAGAFVWGLTPTYVPRASGALCVGAPRRLEFVADAGGTVGCTGVLETRFDAAFLQSHGLTAGTTVFAQGLVRNPAATGARLVLTSHVVSFPVVP